jgi:hypothetical protein
MKIETIAPTQKNTTVKFSDGIRVNFVNGIGEVSEHDGEYLLEKYVGHLFPAGKVVIPEVVKTLTKSSVDGSEAEMLKEKLQKANILINDYKAQVGAAKENERIWRTKCQDLMLENHTLRDQIGKIPAAIETKAAEIVKTDEEKAAEAAQLEASKLRERLEARTIKELTSLVEEMKLPVEEYKMLNKKKLVDYIIAKTNATN